MSTNAQAASERHVQLVAAELGLTTVAVAAAVRLLSEGATVPFIARYRKEATHGLDEAQLRDVHERHAYLVDLAARRERIEQELERQGVLDDALRKQLRAATHKAELEDLYLPFKPRRRTRATAARERGLEPLADAMWRQTSQNPQACARGFVAQDKDVPDEGAALSGARDICAERLADSASLRSRLRQAFREHGQLRVQKAKKHRDEVTKFDDYEAFHARTRDMPSHRVLAVARGESEGVLQVKVEVDLERHTGFAERQIPLRSSPWRTQLDEVVRDTLKRLVVPAAQSECRADLKRDADVAAVEVFARNLRELLLAPPFGARRVLGIDPGQRTGCKCAVVSETGRFLAHDVLYLVQGDRKLADARGTLKRLLREHRIDAVAVGNGTHGRETERFVKEVIREAGSELPTSPVCVAVSESGASIYSASDVARSEFPDLDLTVRGAISIARRLQDPLAELVKLDPKTIGVGQYQHDVDQTLLSDKLREVVESCVNGVGVELNTASATLLSFVAGIGPKLAENIVAQRDAMGRFDDRKQLLKVKGLGPKAFEQAAGFLRIQDGKNALDASAVHPERYVLVQRMAEDLGVSVGALVGDPQLASRIDTARYRKDDVGDFTLQDIVEELAKPGRDPRDSFQAVRFRDGVESLQDLKPGMVLEGVVTNVTAFGAFVDVGVHQDGLVHVSQLADRFVRDPAEVAHVGRPMRVKVLSVDLQRKRISLSARDLQAD